MATRAVSGRVAVGTAASVAAALAARVLVEVAGEAEATVVAQVEVVRVAQEAIEREPCLSPTRSNRRQCRASTSHQPQQVA